VKLRAKRSTWKSVSTEILYFVQYDRIIAPPTNVGLNYSRPLQHVESVTEGPFDDKVLERRIVMTMNRVDVVPESVQVVEMKVDGQWKSRSREQHVSAA